MDGDRTPVVSAIVVSYDTREFTLKCLQALYHELLALPAEVFVVDNGSSDGSATAVRDAFPGVTLIDVGRNIGFGPANNLAMKLARGEFILLLNTDAFVRPGAVATLVRYLRRDERAAIVGPRLLNADGSLQKSCYKYPSPARAACENFLLTAAFPNHRRLGDYRAWPHDRDRYVEFVIGACMLVRGSAIEKVGLFDESFFMYCEETDWCLRFRRAGWSIAFTPAAEVVHLNGASGKAHSDRTFNEFRYSAERYIRKHHGRVGLWAFRVFYVVGSTLRIAVFGIRGMVRGRESDRELTRLWLRILRWNLGARGEGIAAARR